MCLHPISYIVTYSAPHRRSRNIDGGNYGHKTTHQVYDSRAMATVNDIIIHRQHHVKQRLICNSVNNIVRVNTPQQQRRCCHQAGSKRPEVVHNQQRRT